MRSVLLPSIGGTIGRRVLMLFVKKKLTPS